MQIEQEQREVSMEDAVRVLELVEAGKGIARDDVWIVGEAPGTHHR